MKKRNLLLVGAMLLASTSAMAITEEDITPSMYNFKDANVGQFTYMTKFSGANCPAPSPFYGELYNNGLFFVAGGAFAGDTPYFNDLQAGTNIVDLGGTVGKVLCINGVNSTIDAKFKELYDKDVTLPKCTGGLNWFNINFVSDPQNTPVGGTADNPNIRVRVVMNIFQNKISETEDVFTKMYAVNYQGNILPANDNTASKANIRSGEFCETYEDGEPVLDDNDNYVWDPKKWMVYEFDTWAPKDNEGTVVIPFRIKMELSAPTLASSTIFIKEVKILKVTDNTAPILNTRSKTYKEYLIDLPSGVESVVDNTTNYTINGQEVAVTENAEIYSIAGMKVADVKAGSSVSLAKGFYVAKIGNKNAKFVIK